MKQKSHISAKAYILCAAITIAASMSCVMLGFGNPAGYVCAMATAHALPPAAHRYEQLRKLSAEQPKKQAQLPYFLLVCIAYAALFAAVTAGVGKLFGFSSEYIYMASVVIFSHSLYFRISQEPEDSVKDSEKEATT